MQYKGQVTLMEEQLNASNNQLLMMDHYCRTMEKATGAGKNVSVSPESRNTSPNISETLRHG